MSQDIIQEAVRQILSEAFDIKVDLAAGGVKDNEYAFRKLAFQGRYYKLAVEAAMDEMATKINARDNLQAVLYAHGVRDCLKSIERHLAEIAPKMEN